jgi:hypothetical protein
LPRFYAAERGFDRRPPRVIAQQRPDLRAARTMSLIRRPRLSSLLSPSPHLLFPRRPAASASCPHVCTLPRTRGGWSADRRTRLLCRACEARRSALAIRGPSRCNRDALSALHRGDFRPGTHAAVSGSGTGADQRLACARPYGPAGGVPDLPRQRFAPPPQDATPRSACRIVSGDAPHERGCESI